jgi:hypothetical protein
MDLVKSLTVKDFLNYHFAGVIWLLDIFLISLALSNRGMSHALQSIQATTDSLGALVLAVLAVVVPYVTGFTLSLLGSYFTTKLKKQFGDAVKGVTNSDDPHFEGRHLSKTKVRRVLEVVNDVFALGQKKVEANDLHSWFFLIRAYVMNAGGDMAAAADRAKDLANLAESLLVPIPAGIILVGIILLQFSPIYTIVLLGIAMLTFGALARRYMSLREYWVKNIYHAFLVVNAKAPNPTP